MRGADRGSLHALTNLAGAETCDHIIEHPVVLLHRGELGGDFFHNCGLVMPAVTATCALHGSSNRALYRDP